jgi:hypothetical protein
VLFFFNLTLVDISLSKATSLWMTWEFNLSHSGL